MHAVLGTKHEARLPVVNSPNCRSKVLYHQERLLDTLFDSRDRKGRTSENISTYPNNSLYSRCNRQTGCDLRSSEWKCTLQSRASFSFAFRLCVFVCAVRTASHNNSKIYVRIITLTTNTVAEQTHTTHIKKQLRHVNRRHQKVIKVYATHEKSTELTPNRIPCLAYVATSRSARRSNNLHCGESEWGRKKEKDIHERYT